MFFFQTCCGFLHNLRSERQYNGLPPGCSATLALNADTDLDLLAAGNALYTSAPMEYIVTHWKIADNCWSLAIVHDEHFYLPKKWSYKQIESENINDNWMLADKNLLVCNSEIIF